MVLSWSESLVEYTFCHDAQSFCALFITYMILWIVCVIEIMIIITVLTISTTLHLDCLMSLLLQEVREVILLFFIILIFLYLFSFWVRLFWKVLPLLSLLSLSFSYVLISFYVIFCVILIFVTVRKCFHINCVMNIDIC